ncbi:DISARM system SNF2-like helicase DrmD [Rhodococcus opacus]|uniref:DISARM system SNF2-like helicase DrmD n=1 Tax=Rhodococcus opacus TaxID=37919 RepID=UPI002474DB74|nr:DISARM system SNF2-like helicase DrmD [Rhodococcus opacus]MDH6291894.1 superfamily II DNA or RNA helicase [Rhodococcus opacus]
MPKYKFKWSNLKPSLLRALCRDLDLYVDQHDYALALQATYGARPKEEFIRDAWRVLLHSWLRTSKESREWVVQALRDIRGEKGALTGRDAQTEYLEGLRVAKNLRQIVWTELIAVGEIEREDAEHDHVGGSPEALAPTPTSTQPRKHKHPKAPASTPSPSATDGRPQSLQMSHHRRSVVSTALADPEVGQLVRVRGQQWVVSAVDCSTQPVDELAPAELPGRTLVSLSSVSDDDLGRELTVVWEVEPGREIVPATQLPEVQADGFDDPQRLGAFLDAVRWGTIASADTRTLQAPFRSGITIETYQLAPVARALAMPRVNLLIADDVGLGKTIEAGLVAQELLLRHRVRRMMVVCPAPLTGKWKDEMDEKFGLDFTVLDANALRDLRRSHGLLANPFAVFARTIISLQWLRTPRVQRLLDEVLTQETRHPGFIDLLIVDEAHHCAPPAPRKTAGYAVDSLQTRAVRRLGEYSQHRLFLSATPHNGYRESWQALLEMLDPQRFTRGVEPDPKVLGQVMVRRLKDDLVDADGHRLFQGRETQAIEITYSDAERDGHQLLERYLRARRAKVAGDKVRGNDLVALLLKKRLFSSPLAFARTLDAHRATIERGASSHRGELPDYLQEAIGWDDDLLDDESSAQVETEFLLAIDDGVEQDSDSESLRRELVAWTERNVGPADSKAEGLLDELRRLRKSDERVIVFTEYVDTQRWLAELIEASGLGGERLGLLFGGMDEKRREHLKAAFQAPPDRHPIRVLLATDSASEGIDLQLHCHRVIHYDIPFNPNRLEQRIGRVDRHGQDHEVLVSHFVGAGWQQAGPHSYDADLEFLSRVATKVAVEREDLGSVNPVLATAVEAHMLGRPVLVDPLAVKAHPSAQLLRAEQDLRAQVASLRTQLDRSVADLHVRPANVRRVVDTALAMAQQPALRERTPGIIEPPTLRSGWERTLAGQDDPLTGQARPLTFDAELAGPDVVYAHLEHPLVAHSTRLLRSAIWGDASVLHRVAAVRANLSAAAGIDDLLVAVFARLVIVGSDGARLHEEVMLTGRALARTGRGRRLELEQPRFAQLREAIEGALEPDQCRLVPESVCERVVQDWDRLEPLLAQDVQARAKERLSSLVRTLERRRGDEDERIRGVFTQLRKTLQTAVASDGGVQLSFDDLDSAERGQVVRDRQAWQTRLEGLDDELARELSTVSSRYENVRELVFPFAVAVVLPDGAAQ